MCNSFAENNLKVIGYTELKFPAEMKYLDKIINKDGDG